MSFLWLLALQGLASCSMPRIPAFGPDPQVEAPSLDSRRNAALLERQDALARVGDVANGQRLYRTCSSCHRPGAAGVRDGTMPRLAGQHTSVLIKQLTDTRAGVRTNPIMHPYAIPLDGPQEVADVAAYLRSLPIPSDNGKGPGTDLARGRELYRRDCARCHGENGEGDTQHFYPVLAGQHYRYVLRQLIGISQEKRGNANPEMREVVAGYSAEEMSLVSDYASRLRPTGPSVQNGGD
jgi:cytochrome c553